LHAKVDFLEDVHSIKHEIIRDPVHQSEGGALGCQPS
jgi:hypothetical protein